MTASNKATAAAILSICILLVLKFGIDLNQFRQLERTGIDTQAKVTDCTATRGSSSCSYRFSVAGQEYRGSASGSTLSSGEMVAIRYLPTNPADSMQTPYDGDGILIGVLGFAGVTGLMCLFALCWKTKPE